MHLKVCEEGSQVSEEGSQVREEGSQVRHNSGIPYLLRDCFTQLSEFHAQLREASFSHPFVLLQANFTHDFPLHFIDSLLKQI